jgi:hypothetical protein
MAARHQPASRRSFSAVSAGKVLAMHYHAAIAAFTSRQIHPTRLPGARHAVL